MKKILFATTALVATAGVASAEIALSGSAEMGIVGGDAYGNETQFHTDVDVTFTMTGEADNGLTFGASIDLDESDASCSTLTAGVDLNGGGVIGIGDDYSLCTNGSPAFASTTQGGETIFVAYGNMKLTMGDVDGAFDAAMQEVAIGGTIDDLETSHGGFNGNSGFDGGYDGQIAQFAYSMDSFSAFLSVEMDDTGLGDPIWGLGVRYNADLAGLALGVGLGYQTVSIGAVDASVWGLSLDTTFDNGLMARVNYSETDFGFGPNQSHMAIGLGYSMNALTVGFNYGKYDDFGGLAGLESTGYALVGNYDLGGGLTVQAGYSNSELSFGGASVDADQFSLGLAMSF